MVRLGRAQPVDAGDGCHNDDVFPVQQRARRGVTHLVDLVVDVGVLLDVGVRMGNVGLRLVVVVVADEILDGVFREKIPQLPIELRLQASCWAP